MCCSLQGQTKRSLDVAMCYARPANLMKEFPLEQFVFRCVPLSTPTGAIETQGVQEIWGS